METATTDRTAAAPLVGELLPPTTSAPAAPAVLTPRPRRLSGLTDGLRRIIAGPPGRHRRH